MGGVSGIACICEQGPHATLLAAHAHRHSLHIMIYLPHISAPMTVYAYIIGLCKGCISFVCSVIYEFLSEDCIYLLPKGAVIYTTGVKEAGISYAFKRGRWYLSFGYGIVIYIIYRQEDRIYVCGVDIKPAKQW